jgi:glutamine synthetase
MEIAQIIEYVKQHPAGKVKVAVADIDGVLRGKYISKEKFLSIADSSFGFCDVVFGWDVADVAYENATYTGWHTGYPDAKAKIDIGTFRKIPWENDLPFFLGEFITETNEPSPICPRQLLKKIENEAKQAGFKPYVSQEFEWYNFAETPQTAHDKNFQNLAPLTPGMFGYSVLRSSLNNPFFTDLFELLTKFDIPIEGLHTETGPGTYEAAITYGKTVESADRAVLFKTSVKEIAYKHGIMATFMAKISENLPGCGGHVHQSIWNANSSENLFFDETKPNHISETMKSYLAGQLLVLPQILPMIAPTVNSFKRLVEGAWAPTTLTWGVDNRTVAFRALPSGTKATRLETRIIGADTNPYLAIGASLAAGLYGIKNNLQLTQPQTFGNGYIDESNGRLSKNLIDATNLMKNSKIANEILGETFVQHFTQTREWEWQQYSKAVTDWEMKRYFEII